MNDELIKYQNANCEEQLEILNNLELKLKLLQIKKKIKNPNLIPQKKIQSVPMKLLIDIYNSSKSDKVKEILRNDPHYQEIFKNVNNCRGIKADYNSSFFQDFDLIVDTIYQDDFSKANNIKLNFINTYSSFLRFSSLSNIKIYLESFFKTKNKAYYIRIVDLDKLSLSKLVIIYYNYHSIEKYNQKKNIQNNSELLSSKEYVSNKEEMENYLKTHQSLYKKVFLELKEYFSLPVNLRYRNHFSENFQIKQVLELYFKFCQLNDSDYENIMDYLLTTNVKEEFQNIGIYDFLKYKVKKLIQFDYEKLITFITNRDYGYNQMSIVVLILFEFLPYTKENSQYSYHYNHHNFYYLNDYDFAFLTKLNKSHLKTIFNAINKEIYGDEIFYGLRIAINMYSVFGYNRTLDILKGKYGKLPQIFFENISKVKLDCSNCIKENGEINLNQDYLNILFESEKDNNFMKIINDYNLTSIIYVLYNRYEDIKNKYGKLSLKKCIDLLGDDFLQVKPENNLLFDGDLMNNIIVGNRRGVDRDLLISRIETNYSLQQKRVSSTIPYIEGESDGYSYQMMRLNSPIVYNLGYLANCCFRITDAGENDLKHATLDKNARILLYYNESKELIAFSVLNRNGEVIIITSVEFNSLNDKIDQNKLLKVLIKAANDLYQKINQTDNVELITIGANSKIKPKENIPFPGKYNTPMCSSSDTYQANAYHRKQHILLARKNLDYEKLEYSNNVKTYYDPRLKIQKEIITNSNKEKYHKLIERIEKKYIDDDYLVLGDLIVFNEDFYLIVKNDGEVIGSYLEYDERCKLEYESIKKELLDNLKRKVLKK